MELEILPQDRAGLSQESLAPPTTTVCAPTTVDTVSMAVITQRIVAARRSGARSGNTARDPEVLFTFASQAGLLPIVAAESHWSFRLDFSLARRQRYSDGGWTCFDMDPGNLHQREGFRGGRVPKNAAL